LFSFLFPYLQAIAFSGEFDLFHVDFILPLYLPLAASFHVIYLARDFLFFLFDGT
jgi:hypothetical protein